jgi:hypothetical protein
MRAVLVAVGATPPKRAQEVAPEIDGTTRGLAVTLAQLNRRRPRRHRPGRQLVITAFAPTPITLHDFDITAAIAAITVKLVGYTEVVRCLHGRMGEHAAVCSSGDWPRTSHIPGRR